jgi:hypothetical protein
MDETKIKLDVLFGCIKLMEAPPRIDGDKLITRGRSITYDRHGNVTKDETYDLCVITGWEEYAHWFGVARPPKPRTWWQRMFGWIVP